MIDKPKITPSKQGANMKIVLTQEQLEKILKEYFYDNYNVRTGEITFDLALEEFCVIHTKETL